MALRSDTGFQDAAMWSDYAKRRRRKFEQVYDNNDQYKDIEDVRSRRPGVSVGLVPPPAAEQTTSPAEIHSARAAAALAAQAAAKPEIQQAPNIALNPDPGIGAAMRARQDNEDLLKQNIVPQQGNDNAFLMGAMDQQARNEQERNRIEMMKAMKPFASWEVAPDEATVGRDVTTSAFKNFGNMMNDALSSDRPGSMAMINKGNQLAEGRRKEAMIGPAMKALQTAGMMDAMGGRGNFDRVFSRFFG